ncbi:MAG: hypothetical protein KDA60_11580, partial [Planctomycetales bacterium]|nr:hypothetical protein [Planctomycetales bacterium]
MVEIKHTGDTLWERIERAVEKVKERLRRVTSALNEARIPYAVIGGNAVQLWVAQVDETAVRNTRDVDIVLNRTDLDAARGALGLVGFVFHEVSGVPMFLDGPQGTPRDAVHVVFAGEKVRPEHLEPAPDLGQIELIKSLRTLAFPELVRMKLISYRLKDRVHLLDMISVGLIDETWLGRFSPALQTRLKELLDNP